MYESNDEYISKRVASLSVNAAVTGCESKETMEVLAAVLVNINHVPLADVAPVVHGHWSKEMRFTEDFMGNRTYGYKCSVCGKLANRLQFCGNCGAIMDESEGEQ